jgi:hypothetical protein
LDGADLRFCLSFEPESAGRELVCMSIAPGVRLRRKWFRVRGVSAGDHQRVVSAGKLAALDRDNPHRQEALEEGAMILITAIE